MTAAGAASTPAPEPSPLAVPVDGGTLRGGVWSGGPDTPTVVAIHGITSNHLGWAKAGRKLAGAAVPITLAAPDLRGRVRSAGLPGPWGMRRHADDVIAVLDHLDVERTVLAGHSMGAWVVAMVAAKAPERVAGLVLVDGGVSLPLELPAGASPDEVIDAVLGPAVARLRKTYPDRDAYVAEWAAHPAFAGGLDRDTRAVLTADLSGTGFAWRSTVREDAVRTDGTELVVDDEVRDALGRSDCPAVLLRAPRGLLDDENILLPDATVEPVLASRPNTSLVEIPETNHYTILLGDKGAETVAEAIRDMLGQTGWDVE